MRLISYDKIVKIGSQFEKISELSMEFRFFDAKIIFVFFWKADVD